MNDAHDNLTFDYDLGEADRKEFLREAQQTVAALRSDLSGTGIRGGAKMADPAAVAASNLLQQLNEETAEFSSYPDVIELREEHFKDHGLSVPPRFKELGKHSRFYWLRFPITLAPLENRPFHKLECGVEFNPGVGDGHLRPRALMILPDRKFKQLLEVDDSLELRIGENFEFEADTGSLAAPLAVGGAKARAGVEAKAAAKLGFIAGPFKYTIKRAELEHSPTGSEKVFWRISDTTLLHEDEPTLIVVLQVPREVREVKIAAAMQAYHSFNTWAASLSDVIDYFGERLATFFRRGAPIRDTKVWDITHSL